MRSTEKKKEKSIGKVVQLRRDVEKQQSTGGIGKRMMKYRQIRAEVTTVIKRRGANSGEAGVDHVVAGGNGEEESDALWREETQSKQELRERM